MTIEYRKAKAEDAEMLVDIYNASFYSDYRTFGACSGYGKTIEIMEASIRDHPKYIILCDPKPVGCAVPAYQGKGLGTHAVQFVKALYEDWEKITLVTPADKEENVRFYTEKCGFRIVSAETDGNVALARFVAER